MIEQDHSVLFLLLKSTNVEHLKVCIKSVNYFCVKPLFLVTCLCRTVK